jgi:hypothetical protein
MKTPSLRDKTSYPETVGADNASFFKFGGLPEVTFGVARDFE